MFTLITQLEVFPKMEVNANPLSLGPVAVACVYDKVLLLINRLLYTCIKQCNLCWNEAL